MAATFNKVMYCNVCDFVEVSKARKKCPIDATILVEMGFVQRLPHHGGSIRRRACNCGRPTEVKWTDADGVSRYRTQCSICREKARKHPKDSCVNCGVLNDGKGNIDVDHIDGNRSNNEPSNLQALCKDCHKKKTKIDWATKIIKRYKESNV
jgi:5-methylcytosine-specific restriction endonuclease McrA